MKKRGRRMAAWTANLTYLNPDHNYSIEEISRLFSKTNDAAEGQIRNLNIKPSFYLKASKFSRRAFFRGKDITLGFKRKLLLEPDYVEKEIIELTKIIAKYKSRLEIKLNLFFALQLKINPNFKKDLRDVIRIEQASFSMD
ncbi:hypothetical protein [Fluviispira vulneris]|uniref:hypothetical protein n=1 Tax=Fluviispira vulneris TaxID=2763012 RepID=UPI001644C667|nr:hypothetical protein [Fluviispira vulneris]